MMFESQTSSNAPKAPSQTSPCKKETIIVEIHVADLSNHVFRRTKEFFIIPIPKHLQYDPDQPFKFSYIVTVIYSLMSMITIMNAYYCQPLLIEMAKTFGVSYTSISRIPTFVQVGYAAGLLLLLPLADILRRRQFTLVLVFITLVFTIGQAFTRDIRVFEVLSCLGNSTNIASQIIAPMVAEFAPPKQRAFVFSIVLTGIMFGILAARVVAGIIGQFLDWRIVYYASFTLQSVAFVVLYLIIPDYPAKNPDLSYWRMYWSMARLAVAEPIALQVMIINIGGSACFAYFWVTMTFLLGGSPYFYSTLDIGLFGLIGLAGVAAGPICGRICDKLHPWHALLIANCTLLVFQAVQTAAGGVHIAALIVAGIGLDIVQQVQNVGLVILILSVSSTATSRLNTLYMLSYYIGMIIGTAAGTQIFVRYGWRAAGGFGMGLYGMQVIVLLLRGPNCKRNTWFGYQGGLSYSIDELPTNTSQTEGVDVCSERIEA